jgi:hypothetical protein
MGSRPKNQREGKLESKHMDQMSIVYKTTFNVAGNETVLWTERVAVQPRRCLLARGFRLSELGYPLAYVGAQDLSQPLTSVLCLRGALRCNRS